VIIAMVFLFVVWIVWPARHKDLTLRLRFIRSEVVNGQTKLLFRVEGAEQYQIFIKGFLYIRGNDQPVQRYPFSLHNYQQIGRQFYADPPLYSHNNDQGWKMQAGVSVVAQDKSLTRLYDVIKTSWLFHKNQPLPIFSLAKVLWKLPTPPMSEQVITSDLITNCPVIQFP